MEGGAATGVAVTSSLGEEAAGAAEASFFYSGATHGMGSDNII